ncbi:UNVERIFIED_CONTAM: hypothetical protein Sangu_0577400 [Sesamum angustifolium]|uniref:J domain-containing protein n=1 Tax=Sesamum angustifolium TaxID=2727405 RepID=A0AAW2QAK6_9LAMI
MEPISLCNRNIADPQYSHRWLRPFTSKFGKPSLCSSSVGVKCSSGSGKNGDFDEDDEPLTTSWAYGVLGLHPQCSSAQVKAAFRTQVKQFHPDLKRGGQDSDIMIRRVIQAYELTSFDKDHFELNFYQQSVYFRATSIAIKASSQFSVVDVDMLRRKKRDLGSEGTTVVGVLHWFNNVLTPDTVVIHDFHAHNFHMCRECMDPFDQPECEAFDVFVNEVLCTGKGCPYSCVNRAPHAFKFSSVTGTARAASQGHAEDYQVQLAVGQCPRGCIHYVTPSQRVILEELLETILNMPYDTSAEAELLYSLIVKANYENNRYQTPKRNAKVSSKHVDWF